MGTDATPPPFLQISGVAPCASIRAYKVCPTNDCPDADIEAGIDSVLIHGDAKVLSFSISGGTDPWNDNDRDFLDVVDSGVLVSASAGNTSAGVPDPVGQVNHRGPWVLYSSRIHQGPGALRWCDIGERSRQTSAGHPEYWPHQRKRFA